MLTSSAIQHNLARKGKVNPLHAQRSTTARPHYNHSIRRPRGPATLKAHHLSRTINIPFANTLAQFTRLVYAAPTAHHHQITQSSPHCA
jgi:hypothetical protein